MKTLSSIGVFVLIFMMAGCDIVEKDSIVSDVKQIKMYAASNKAAVIDLQKVFTGFSGAVVPAGNSRLTYFSDRYLKYKSATVDGDRFSFDVKEGSKNVRVNVNLATQGDNVSSCDKIAAFTYATISNRDVLVVNLLNNPEFCGYDIYSGGEIGVGGSRPGVDVTQNIEGLTIAMCACLPEGNSGILTYIPPAGFVGQVKYKYYVHAGYHGTGSPEEDEFYEAENFDYFTAHEFVIDVTDGSL